MEKDMETTTLYMGYSRGSIGMIEKENGHYYSMLGII